MANLTMQRVLWSAAESAFETDPSTDGSGYSAMLHDGPIDVKMMVDNIVYNASTGVNADIQPTAGRKSWELSIKFHFRGFDAFVDDAASPTADVYSPHYTNVFGTRTAVDGEGVAAVPSATAVTLDSDLVNAGDMLLIREAAVPSAPRVQPQFVGVDGGAGAYTSLSPGFADFGTAPPTAAAVAIGHERYTHDPSAAEPASLALVVYDGTTYWRLLGGNYTSAKIVIPPDRTKAYLEGTIAGTDWTDDTAAKTSLPAQPTSITAPVVNGRRSPVYFAGTAYATPGIEIDMGIARANVGATSGDHGSAGMQRTFGTPTVTITPEFTATIAQWKANETNGVLMVQLGGGEVTGAYANMFAFCIPNASVETDDNADQDGIARKSIGFRVNKDTVGSNQFMMVRA